MKRRNFFKNLAIGAGALIVAPKMIAEISLEEDKTNPNKILKEPFDIPKSDLIDMEDGEYRNQKLHESFKAIISDKEYFYTRGHKVRVNDTILVSGGRLQCQYIVTEVLSDCHFKAVCMRNDFMLNGRVECLLVIKYWGLGDSYKPRNK